MNGAPFVAKQSVVATLKRGDLVMMDSLPAAKRPLQAGRLRKLNDLESLLTLASSSKGV
jgi:hypothetical protein